jgi:hypothetical protein
MTSTSARAPEFNTKELDMNRTLTLLAIAAAGGGFTAAGAATTRHAAHSTSATTTAATATAVPHGASATQGIAIPRGVVVNLDGTAIAASAARPSAAARKTSEPVSHRGKAAASAPPGQVYSTDSTLRSPGGLVTQSNPAH